MALGRVCGRQGKGDRTEVEGLPLCSHMAGKALGGGQCCQPAGSWGAWLKGLWGHTFTRLRSQNSVPEARVVQLAAAAEQKVAARGDQDDET